MTRTVLSADAVANPTGAPVEAAINAILAALTSSVIKAFNLVLTDKSPASTRAIRAVIDSESGGATLLSAYQVRILEATDDASLVAMANAFMAANPTWFYSPILYLYSDQAQGQTLRSVGAIVYTSDAANGAANWQAGGGSGEQAVITLADGATIATDASLGSTFQVTLGDNRTLGNPTNMVDGATYQWIIRQDVVGGRTLAYDTKWTWPGGSVPTIGAAANAVSVISAVYDGTADRLRAVASLSFA